MAQDHSSIERLFIAEKPKVGQAIAKALVSMNPAAQASKGFDKANKLAYFRIGDDVVTWAFGHIFELASPEEYDPKYARWDLDHLPIRIAADQWLLRPHPDKVDQVNVIGKLLQKAKIVVNAGDPDREGQMLVDEILEHFEWKGSALRLLMSDHTNVSVMRELRRMVDNAKFANLYLAAKCRARADYLVGYNFTRAASKKIGLTAPIGRVKHPVLTLVVVRDRLIEAHQEQYFYTLHAKVSMLEAAGSSSVTALEMSHEPANNRITDEKVAKAIAAQLTGSTVEVAVKNRKVARGAPLPYSLPTFQKDAEAVYGWSAKKSLQTLQALYDQKFVSYPRSKCAYLPEEQAGMALRIVDRILAGGWHPDAAAVRQHMAPSKTVYNDKKVEEHHGIVPTSEVPKDDLNGDARKAWLLVSQRFLASLMPALQVAVTDATFDAEGREFKATGEVMLNQPASWAAIIAPKGDKQRLPIRYPEDTTVRGRVQEVATKKGKTSPPERYTQASLIEDMTSVAKYVADERLRAVLKETAGIGTVATQADTIEGLLSSQLLMEEQSRKKKYIRSTDFGRYLVDHMPAAIGNVGVTGSWEIQLDLIAKGQASGADFMDKIERFVDRHVSTIKALDLPTPPRKPEKTAKTERGVKKSTATKRRKTASAVV